MHGGWSAFGNRQGDIRRAEDVTEGIHNLELDTQGLHLEAGDLLVLLEVGPQSEAWRQEVNDLTPNADPNLNSNACRRLRGCRLKLGVWVQISHMFRFSLVASNQRLRLEKGR